MSCDELLILSENYKKFLLNINNGVPEKFTLISIETSSGCNSDCSFCPVNKLSDPRPSGFLSLEIINKIASELNKIKYSSTILLFGNNEPLLDPRIFDIVSIFRNNCPLAYIKILTNGLLLTVEKAIELFNRGLSTLIVNNYSLDSSLSKSVCRMISEAEKFKCYDVRISLRNKKENLTNRAGYIKWKNFPDNLNLFCMIPFVNLTVSYTGICKLCCFDATGKTNMGDVEKLSLLKIWNNKKFNKVRNKMICRNRMVITFCKRCDFDGFRAPVQDWAMPLTREDMLAY